MSLKIQNNISSIKINGHYIKEAKLNGYIVYKLKDEETSNYTIAEEWWHYVNGSVEGSLTRDNLDVWVTDTSNGGRHGLFLNFTITGTHNLKATFEFTGYKGCPRYQTCRIINMHSGSYEFTMYFDEDGTNFTRTINQILETGDYVLFIGSENNMDFGVKCTEVSLSPEIPQNLFDLTHYSFPIAQNGLTIDYDNVKKSLIINGECTRELYLSIPLSIPIPRANYTFSYQETQQDLGFYLALDRADDSILDGWGNNNATFDVYDTSDELLLLFEPGYIYDNLELSFNLVRNHDLPEES